MKSNLINRIIRANRQYYRTLKNRSEMASKKLVDRSTKPLPRDKKGKKIDISSDIEFDLDKIELLNADDILLGYVKQDCMLISYLTIQFYEQIGRIQTFAGISSRGYLYPCFGIEYPKEININRGAHNPHPSAIWGILWLYNRYIRNQEVLPKDCTIEKIEKYSFKELLKIFKTPLFCQMYGVFEYNQQCITGKVVISAEQFLICLIVTCNYVSENSKVFELSPGRDLVEEYKNTTVVMFPEILWCVRHLYDSDGKCSNRMIALAHARIFKSALLQKNVVESGYKIHSQSITYIDDCMKKLVYKSTVPDEFGRKFDPKVMQIEYPFPVSVLLERHIEMARKKYSKTVHDFLVESCELAMKKFIRGLEYFCEVADMQKHIFGIIDPPKFDYQDAGGYDHDAMETGRSLSPAVNHRQCQVLNAFLERFGNSEEKIMERAKLINAMVLCRAASRKIDWGPPEIKCIVQVASFLKNKNLLKIYTEVLDRSDPLAIYSDSVEPDADTSDASILDEHSLEYIVGKNAAIASAFCCEMHGWGDNTILALKSRWPMYPR